MRPARPQVRRGRGRAARKPSSSRRRRDREQRHPEHVDAATTARLLASGQAYVHTDLATELLGFPTAASLWLSVAPGDLERVGARVAALRQTTFVAAVSGPANLTASLVCRSETELYALLTDEVGAIDAVRAAEVSPVIRRIKQAGTVLHGARLSL